MTIHYAVQWTTTGKLLSSQLHDERDEAEERIRYRLDWSPSDEGKLRVVKVRIEDAMRVDLSDEQTAFLRSTKHDAPAAAIVALLQVAHDNSEQLGAVDKIMDPLTQAYEFALDATMYGYPGVVLHGWDPQLEPTKKGGDQAMDEQEQPAAEAEATADEASASASSTDADEAANADDSADEGDDDE